MQEAFPRVPARYIEEVFKHYGHFYGAYLAIAKAERQYGADKDNPYMMLKSRRHNGGLNSEGLMLRLKLEGHDFDDLKKEIEAARQRREKDDRKFMPLDILIHSFCLNTVELLIFSTILDLDYQCIANFLYFP